MPQSGGDRIATTLRSWEIPQLFALCGGHISPILVGAKRSGIRVVDVRDEAAAVFAADAAARLTGTIGVAAVTAGPGVANTITALKNAQLAQSPLLLLGGAAPTLLRGRGALQDVDQRALVRPHVKWAGTATRVRDLVPLMHEAVQAARRGVPGPVFLECPIDVLYEETIVREWYGAATAGAGGGLRARAERWYLRRHVDRMFARDDRREPPPYPGREAATPAPGRVAEAANLLRRARRPVLLAGSQVVLDPGRTEAVADGLRALGIPTYLSGMARGLIGRPGDPLLRHARRDALRAADVVVLAGVPCDFRLDYGRHITRAARIIAANLSGAEARKNRRPAVLASGDPARFLTALAAAAPAADRWRPWHEELAARDAARDADIEARASRVGDRVNPLALLRGIESTAGADATFILDGGDFAASASYVLAPRGPLHHLDPGVFGTLGVGGGFALGAAVARPGREVWIVYGDGAAAYSLAEFDTFVRHGLPVIAVVGNDASWAQIARDQVAILGDDVGTALRRTAYHTVAAGYGGAGLLLERTADIPDVLTRARALAAAGQPVLVNALLDPSDFRKGAISM